MRRGPLLTIAPSGYNYEGRDEAWSFTNHCPPQAITMRVEMRRGPLLTIAPPQAITMRVEMRRGPLLTIAPLRL